MYFTFQCPQCGKNLKVREEIAGRKCGCPYCKATINVPMPSPPAPPEENKPGGIEVKGSVAAARRRKGSAPTGGGSVAQVSGTDVSMIRSGLIGAAGGGLFLLLMFPLLGTYLGDLFLDRGWVPYALVLFMGWSAAILVLKWRKLKRQKASMLFDLLPAELSEEISADSLDKFTQHIRNLPVEPGSSFLINRVLRGLEHFRVRKSAAEVATVLASQSEIDANAVESSYTLVKVFIWAIPILGFIGTVIGISGAVGGFAGSLEDASDISVLKESLNSVTGGLATAFDTTLIALVMSMMVMFPSSSMQKAEEDLLNWVDEYCNENLLKRLDDGGGGRGPAVAGASSSEMERAIQAALAGHHAELRTWTKKLDALGEKLARDVASTWAEGCRQLADQQEQTLGNSLNQAAETSAALQQSAIQLAETLRGLSAQTAEVKQNANQAMHGAAEELQASFAGLRQGLQSLNEVLEQLGRQQVVVQVQRRGWFGRKNGK